MGYCRDKFDAGRHGFMRDVAGFNMARVEEKARASDLCAGETF